MLPSKLINLRIESGITTFFEKELKELYFINGWKLPPSKHEGNIWDNSYFRVTIKEQYPDEAYKTFVFDLLNFPGYSEKGIISYFHTFEFSISREYPAKLNTIKIFSITPLYHMRIAERHRVPACYLINGEIDSILRNLIDFVLLKPEVVLPSGSDSGYNPSMTEWYKKENPMKIYQYLFSLWAKQQTLIIVKQKSKPIILNATK